MNPIAVLDVLALLAFGLAAALALRIPTRVPEVGRLVKYTLFSVAGLYFAVSLSNVLEHAGLTAALDVYEDFAEVLFVPIVAWAIYTRIGAERLVAARRAEDTIRSEHELLTSIVETSPAGIVVADTEGTVHFSNELADEMLGRALEGQLDLGAIVRSVPEPRLHEPIGAGENAVYLSIRSTQLSTGSDGPARAVLVLADVTDRVRSDFEVEEYRQGLERAIDRRTGELLEANRQLQQASDAKQQFLAKMSHELRTPLNSIIGFSEIMLKGLSGPITDDQATQLAMVRNSGTQLLGLVNDVLEISRIEAGYSPVSVAQVNVCARTRELVESMSAVAATHDVRLECECAPGPLVTTDPDKLDQIVRNLISNAVKFTDPGGSVGVTVVHDADCVAISVSDSGIGIASSDQDRIFEAFQQVETPDRVRPEGTGLGLMICRELAGALGCTLMLESTPGQGSVFTVTVPRQFPGHLVFL